MLKKLFAVVVCSLLLQACGNAHVRQVSNSDNLVNYSAAFVDEVKVSSKERNPDATAINVKMRHYAEQKLAEIITAKKYQVIPAADAKANNALAFNIDVNVVYGNRAARYFAGFGAGKGSVTSRLKVVDSVSNETVFSSFAESELKFGAFGGSMESVLKDNIDKLLATYPQN